MATFKCARCNYLRESATAACDKCGWAPKKESYDAAARDVGSAVVNEVRAAAEAKWRERLLAVFVIGALPLFYLVTYLSSGPLGERCEENEDCRSHLCLEMHSGPNICTERCEGAECEEGFSCVGATTRTTNRRTFQARESSAKVCVPTSLVPPPEPEEEEDPAAAE